MLAKGVCIDVMRAEAGVWIDRLKQGNAVSERLERFERGGEAKGPCVAAAR